MLEPSDLLFTTAELRAGFASPSDIRRAVRRGEIVRIRRGTYCAGETWRAIGDRQRHVLLACAVSREMTSGAVAGLSAAAVWDVPNLGSWPREVVVLDRYRGGGRSEPGVRRTVVGAEDAPVVRHNGIPVTSLERTVVDLAGSVGLEQGVVAADWALARGIDRRELENAALTRRSRYGRATIASALAFADAGAESPGESVTRLAIHRAGFAPPELQTEFWDSEGLMRVDFFWPEAGVTGEFDGKTKYGRDNHSGLEPAEVVWREKRREDRLRRIHPGHVRIVWPDLSGNRIAGILEAAGVPRGGSVRLAVVVTPAKRTVIQLGARG